MKKTIETLLLTLIITLIAFSNTACSDTHDTLQTREMTPFVVRGGQGVSGAFAGTVGKNHRIIVAGGCNFPDIPASMRGEKVFYGNIYELVSSADTAKKDVWKKVGMLPETCAYGASVTTSEGIICLGGMDENGSSDRVTMLYEGENGFLQLREMPSLPVKMDNMAAAYGDGYVYVAGGNADGKARNVAYRMEMATAKEWEQLPDFPGLPRIQPSAAMQKSKDGLLFYLIGGYYVDNNAGKATVYSDGIAYNPRTKKWTSTSQAVPSNTSKAMAIVGAQAISMGQSRIVCIGGVNKEIFQNALLKQALQASGRSRKSEVLREKEYYEYMTHPSEWYKFNDRLLVFDTLTDTWSLSGQSEKLARAGASVVVVDSEVLIICGEEKPGVRSTDVTSVKIE